MGFPKTAQELLRQLSVETLYWWREHRFDVTGEHEEHNVYDDLPKHVTLALEALEAMNVEAILTAEVRKHG